MRTIEMITSGFDPCFGFKIVPKGTKIVVKVQDNGEMRLVWSEIEGNYPGYGYRIYGLSEVA